MEPVWPQVEHRRKIFSEKWPVAELRKKNVTSLMFFNGKILLHIFAVHFERALRLVIIILITYLNGCFFLKITFILFSYLFSFVAKEFICRIWSWYKNIIMILWLQLLIKLTDKKTTNTKSFKFSVQLVCYLYST